MREFRELYGPYSRWGFKHPGPAPFFVYGIAEPIAYEFLKIVPAPCNAYVLANVFLNSFFFVSALLIMARWTSARCFVPLALVLGALHLGRLGWWPFLGVWPADTPVMMFLCLLAAAASVAAGHAAHLPLLVLAGGFLVHLHVSQPLYVVPLALVAYGSLLWRHRGRTPAAMLPQRWVPTVWRTSARSHAVAAVILALFLLPLILDAARGAGSNLAKIVAHRQGVVDGSHDFGKSFFYFLQFGSYLTYAPGRAEFDNYSASGAWRFIQANAKLYLAWLACWLVPAGWAVARFAARRRSGQRTDPSARDRLPEFVAFACAIAALAVLCTVQWGRMQDWPMLYYLGNVNYAIYYFCALIAAALIAHWPARWQPVLWETLLYGSFAYICWSRAEAFVVRPPNADGARTKETVGQAFTLDPKPDSPKLLVFPHDAWPIAAGVALQIDRANKRFFVSPEWGNLFGAPRRWTLCAQQRLPRGPSVWNITHGEPTAGSLPLPGGFALRVHRPVARLDSQAAIVFSKDGNFGAYALYGWADTDGEWTASVGHTAILEFIASP